MSKLTAVLLSSALRVCGLAMVKQLVVLPLATGMSLMMCMSALRTTRLTAKYVIFPRIDQKSCFKSMLSANLLPLVVPGVLVGDEIVTDVHAVEALMQLHGDEVLCVLSTTRYSTKLRVFHTSLLMIVRAQLFRSSRSRRC